MITLYKQDTRSSVITGITKYKGACLKAKESQRSFVKCVTEQLGGLMKMWSFVILTFTHKAFEINALHRFGSQEYI